MAMKVDLYGHGFLEIPWDWPVARLLWGSRGRARFLYGLKAKLKKQLKGKLEELPQNLRVSLC